MGEKRLEIKALKEKIVTIQGREAGNSAEHYFDHIERLRGLENSNENRQQLREAIKRVVEKIVVLPVKLGKLTRSEVGVVVEITFHSGARKTYIEGIPMASTDYAPTTSGLLERTKEEIAEIEKDIRNLAGVDPTLDFTPKPVPAAPPEPAKYPARYKGTRGRRRKKE